MYAMVESVNDSEGAKVKVAIYADERLYSSKLFDSRAAAWSALRYSGWIRTNGTMWSPALPSAPTYSATLYYGDPVSSDSMAELGIPDLRLHVVESPHGYAFRFAFDESRQKDPVTELLSGGLVKIECIGTWTALDAAKEAGLAFFKSVQQLVGSEVLVVMLDMVRKKWQCQTTK